MTGYVARRTKEVTAHWDSANGGEPFRATIVTSLSFAEIEAIPFAGTTTYKEIFDAIHPYVLEWNALALNLETHEYEVAPPPATAGPDVFRTVDPLIASFLALSLKTVHQGNPEERQKKEQPASDTPGGKPVAMLGSARQATNRKSRGTTTSISGSI